MLKNPAVPLIWDRSREPIRPAACIVLRRFTVPTTLVLATLGLATLGLVSSPILAHASPCSEGIARVERALTVAQARGEVVPSAPESSFATLHRQPTPATVASAEKQADESRKAALAHARKLDAEGKESECMAAVKDLAAPLGVH